METPLFAAVTAGNLPEVKELLKKETKETIDAVNLRYFTSGKKILLVLEIFISVKNKMQKYSENIM